MIGSCANDLVFLLSLDLYTQHSLTLPLDSSQGRNSSSGDVPKLCLCSCASESVVALPSSSSWMHFLWRL